MHLFFSGGNCLSLLCSSHFHEETTVFCLGGDNKEQLVTTYVSAVLVEQMAQCTVADLGDSSVADLDDTSAANILFHADTCC